MAEHPFSPAPCTTEPKAPDCAEVVAEGPQPDDVAHNNDHSAGPLPQPSHHLVKCSNDPNVFENASKNDVYVYMFRFNQDGTCFIAATTAGFRVFTCSPLSEFVRRETGVGEPNVWIHGSVTVAAMLYRSHCFAFVPEKEPRRVQFWDDRRCETLGEIWCRHPILQVLLGREVVAVVTQTSVYLYLAGTITPLSVVATGYNPYGLCALAETASPSSWRLACPTVTPGALRLQAAQCAAHSNGGLVIQAHQSPIGCIALSHSGTVVATASVNGTLVRLFSTNDGWRLHELRIGAIPHSVRCIMFRPDGLFIAVSSNSRTIHIFKLASERDHDAYPLKNTTSYAERTGLAGVLGGHFVLHSSPSTPKDSYLETFMPTSQNHAQRSPLRCHGGTLCGTKAQSKLQSLSRRSFSALTFAVMNQSRELVQETLKSVLPHYFAPIRSFAQLILPVDRVGEVDVRHDPTKGSTGSSVTDTGPSASMRALRLNPSYSKTRKPGCYGVWSDDHIDTRCAGPLCAFAGQRSNHFYVIHHDGFLYEARFDAKHGGICQLLTVTPWFAPRRDFTVEVRFRTSGLKAMAFRARQRLLPT